MQLAMQLNGTAALAALKTISDQKGRIICVTPLKAGETIWYRLPNGKHCTIGTNPSPSYSGVNGRSGNEHLNFAMALSEHLQALEQGGVGVGFSVEELLAVTV